MSSYEETSSGVFDGIIGREFPLEDLDAFSEGIPEAPDRCKGCRVYGQAVCDIIDRRRYIAGEAEGEPIEDTLLKERLERMYTAPTGKRYESDDELISKIKCMTENCLGVGCELGEDGRTPIAVCGSSEQPISD